MPGEFCLMRGVDEGCLLSLSEMPNGTCLIKACAEQRVICITCPIESLVSIEPGGSAHLAGPDGLCAVERDRNTVRFRFITSERRARSYEVDATRFGAAIGMLAATSFAELS